MLWALQTRHNQIANHFLLQLVAQQYWLFEIQIQTYILELPDNMHHNPT